jgi:hypothetical protein
MFARRIRLEIEEEGSARPCPLDWLDHFFMRHFTGLSALDDTLPAGEGRLEAGFNADLELLRREFENWLRGRKMIAPGARLVVSTESVITTES